MELAPGESMYLNTHGVALYRAGRFAEAVAVLERSLAAGFGQYDGFDMFFLATVDAEGRAKLAANAGLRLAFGRAVDGRTGIDGFDDWARELTATHWLHNHARMWFASIWIFTLRLPWALGADFFMRHLIDGDPASNTLSWRWVAGLHTRSKPYAARA